MTGNRFQSHLTPADRNWRGKDQFDLLGTTCSGKRMAGCFERAARLWGSISRLAAAAAASRIISGATVLPWYGTGVGTCSAEKVAHLGKIEREIALEKGVPTPPKGWLGVAGNRGKRRGRRGDGTDLWYRSSSFFFSFPFPSFFFGAKMQIEHKIGHVPTCAAAASARRARASPYTLSSP